MTRASESAQVRTPGQPSGLPVKRSGYADGDNGACGALVLMHNGQYGDADDGRKETPDGHNVVGV